MAHKEWTCVLIDVSSGMQPHLADAIATVRDLLCGKLFTSSPKGCHVAIGLLGTTAEVAGSLKLRRRELGRDPNLAPKKQKYVGGTITFAVGLHVCLVSSAAARADARARAARQKEKADRREKARSKYPMHAD